MRSVNVDERKSLIGDILSVINDAENASLKAIKEFAPYISDKGNPLPFLCKTVEDYSLPVGDEEYKNFLGNLDKNLHYSYLRPKMDFNKAIAAICECITMGNFVADDFVKYINTQYESDVDNARLAEMFLATVGKSKIKTDFSTITRTKGDATYYAYQVHLALKKKVGIRSETLKRK
jgi:hypothetical protein